MPEQNRMKFKDKLILQFLEYDHFLTITRFIDEVTNERANILNLVPFRKHIYY